MKEPILFRIILLAASFLLQLGTLCFHSHAAAGDVDLSFDPGSGINGPVNAVVVQPDGKIIIGGKFTTVMGLSRTNLARLNADGSGDASFDGGAATAAWFNLNVLAMQADGKILAGHDAGLSRFHSDGRLDTNFNAVLNPVCSEEYGCYLNVDSVDPQADGRVLVAGTFFAGTGTNAVQGLARLNTDGSLDAGFHPAGLNSWTSPVALQPDGRILVGGYSITNVCDVHGCYDDYRYSFVRLNANGSPDGTFNAGTGLPWIQKITLQSDGRMLVVGGFTNGNLIRLHANGSADGSFSPVTANAIESVAVQSDGNVLIGGGFDLLNGSIRRGIARLNASGSLEAGFNPGAGFTVLNYPIVQAVALQADGRIVIGGNFTSVNSANHSHLDRLNSDGSLDSGFNPGRPVARFSALAVQPDGKVLIGGPLTFVNGTNRYGSARLNPDGSLDSTFIPASFWPVVGDLGVPFDPSFGDYITFTAFAVQPDGKVLIAGIAFHYECDEGGCVVYDGYFVTRHHADGSRDTSFTPALGNQIYGGGETVRALAVQPDGKVVVGGYFHAINETSRNAIARLNANGTLDTNSALGMGGAHENVVGALAAQPDGKVLVSGSFATGNSTNHGGIARLNSDTSLDLSFNPTPGTYGGQIALQPDGKFIVGLSRLNSNGSLDSSFNPGTGANGAVRSIALQSDGNILLGGDFTTVNGVVRPYIARLFGDSVVAPPSLNIARSNALVTISWPLSADFVLDQSLTTTGIWSQVAFPYTTNANVISVSPPAPTGNKFYRLRRP